jgi:hypothetical protein
MRILVGTGDGLHEFDLAGAARPLDQIVHAVTALGAE